MNRPISNNYFIKTKAIIMKLAVIACLSLPIVLLAKTSACAETLYGPGTIIIPTNQTIVINTIGINAKLYIDGQFVDTNPAAFNVNNPRFAIAGPHSVTTTDENGPDVFVTFQRVKGPLINTVVTSGGQTNTVNVPAGKTIQFFDWLGRTELTVTIQPTNSVAKYNLVSHVYNQFTHPSATGPATVEISSVIGSTSIVSYYFVSRPRTTPPTDLIY